MSSTPPTTWRCTLSETGRRVFLAGYRGAGRTAWIRELSLSLSEFDQLFSEISRVRVQISEEVQS